MIGKRVKDREKDGLKGKIKGLEGENEEVWDRVGKGIVEKEGKGRKVLKGEKEKEYYREEMENGRRTSKRVRREKEEVKRERKELKKEVGKMKELLNWEEVEGLRDDLGKI